MRNLVLALGLMLMVGLAACGEVATPTTIPAATATVAATEVPAGTTATTEATAVGTATTEATAVGTATTEATAVGTATETGMMGTPGAAMTVTGEATPFSTPTEAGMMGTPASGTPGAGGTPAAGGTPTLSDPRQVVQDFLTSLQSSSDGSASLPYLSDLMQLRVASGKPVLTLVGIQKAPQSFTVAQVKTTGTNTATVQATLNTDTGTVNKEFSLNNYNGAWTINSITAVTPGQ